MNKIIPWVVGGVAVLTLLIFCISYFFVNRDKTTASVHSSNVHVYSVKEALTLMAASTDYFSANKTISIKAMHADSTDGIGCSDYMVLMDKEDADQYKLLTSYLYGPMKKDYRQQITQEIQKLPRIFTGPALSMDQHIFPTIYAVYQGHFNDPSLSKTCPDGNKRFVISRKIEELSSATSSTQQKGAPITEK